MTGYRSLTAVWPLHETFFGPDVSGRAELAAWRPLTSLEPGRNGCHKAIYAVGDVIVRSVPAGSLIRQAG